MSGCSTCTTLTAADGKVSGCKSNGGCDSGGCNKLNVFDWLSNMDMPSNDTFDKVEIRFKNGRKEIYHNADGLSLYPGDAVVVDVPNGHHIGHISLQGELVRLQMQRKKIAQDDKDIKGIYRIASSRDLEKFEACKNKEEVMLFRTREIIQKQKLNMKLTDVEFQADGNKATFYYSASERVDFRELIKLMASEFRIRIEMRQISLRQEAGRLGGIGSCGRELCCSTWLSEFKSVSTSAARYQNLSLNPSKLSGQCGRLKCCLNYELETYIEILKEIPKVEKPLLIKSGEAWLRKTDIFRKTMWFGFKDENTWIPVSADRVKEIQALNKAKQKPDTLLEDELEEITHNISTINSDLENLDRKYGEKNKKKKKRNSNKRRNKNYKKKPNNNRNAAK